VIVASLSDLEGEKLALAIQPATLRPMGARSGKQYLRQYNQIPDRTQPPTMSGIAAPVYVSVPKDKEKQKEIRFDESLKKNPS